MQTQQKLTLWLNKKNLMNGMIAIFFMIILIVYMLYVLSEENPQSPLLSAEYIKIIVLTGIKWFLYFGLSFFVIGLVLSLFSIDTRTPVAVLDQKGIWVNHYGFVPWENIDVIMPYPIGGTNMLGGLGIMVKDPNIFLGQADRQGKVGLFWAKFFGYFHITYYHINISNVDVPIGEIISFAQEQMKNKND